jgi:WD repeat-containing protein 24
MQKAMGDAPSLPTSQGAGIYPSQEDISVFVKLARVYVFQGENRQDICSHNAEVGRLLFINKSARTLTCYL